MNYFISSLLIASLTLPTHGHWPDVPLIDTSCERVMRGFDEDDISALYYNNIAGTLLLRYEFGDGTVIDTNWIIMDLAHESAADYTIKLDRFPMSYSIFFRGKYELWVDQVGNGNCRDFELRLEQTLP